MILSATELARNDVSIQYRVVYGYEGNNKIVVQGSGSGGLEELKGILQDDQVHYGYLRVVSGDSESKRAKFVFISWVGEKVGALKRAKVSVHKASVKQVIQVCIFSPLSFSSFVFFHPVCSYLTLFLFSFFFSELCY